MSVNKNARRANHVIYVKKALDLYLPTIRNSFRLNKIYN